jgi:hypothetical protein
MVNYSNHLYLALCEKLPGQSSPLCLSFQAFLSPPFFLFFLFIFYTDHNIGHKGSEIGDFVTAVYLKHSITSLLQSLQILLSLVAFINVAVTTSFVKDKIKFNLHFLFKSPNGIFIIKNKILALSIESC